MTTEEYFALKIGDKISYIEEIITESAVWENGVKIKPNETEVVSDTGKVISISAEYMTFRVQWESDNGFFNKSVTDVNYLDHYHTKIS
jgi:hypothetical protein